MSKRIFLLAVLLGAILSTSAFGQNLFVSSGDNVSSVVHSFKEDPFTGPASVIGAPNFFLALPAGPRFYLVSKNALNTVVVVDANMAFIRKFDLGAPATGGGVSPDGRRIVILAGGLKVYDTSTDLEVPITFSDVISPTDVAFSFDSRRAFVLSSASQRLSTIDLISNTQVGTPTTISGTSTGVAAGPNGLIYVSAQQSVYEYQYDPNSLNLALRGQFSLTGTPGKLSFTPDGSKAVAVNTGIAGSGTAIFVLDLATRQLSGQVPISSLSFSKVVTADNGRFFAIATQNSKLYQFSFSNLALFQEASFLGIGSFTSVRDIAITHEAPLARYLFVSSGSNVYRIDLSVNQVSGVLGIAGNTAGDLSFAVPANQGTISVLLPFNANQSVNPGSVSLPLLVKVTDYIGRPSSGARINFTTSAAGLTIQTPSVLTGIDGVAGTTVVAPITGGQYGVIATTEGSSLATSFNLNVTSSGTGGGTGGGSGGGGSTAGLQIYSGQGEVLTQFQSSVTQEPLKVRVLDAAGNGVPGVAISWSVNDQVGTAGYLDRATSLTDVAGFAEANFIASQVVGGGFQQPFGRSSVIASTGSEVVTFTIITLAPLQGGTQGFIGINLRKPTDQRINGKVGETIPGAIQVQITANGSTPLPGVGIRVFEGDGLTGPSSLCTAGIILTDVNGFASCDLRVSGVVGESTLKVKIGSTIETPITLTATPGDPAGFRNVSGSNQEGLAGQRLALPLVAEVVDASGNAVQAANVTWEVPVAGSATLTNTISTADNFGRVSTFVTLGSTPGPVTVNLRAGTAVLPFTLTVRVSVAGIAYVSGEGQIAVVNQAFGQPLAVRVTNAQGQGLSNIDVSYAVISGSATLPAATAKTDSNGQASLTVTAGATPGPIVIQASVSGQNPVRFNLTARLPGPLLDETQIFNAAGFQRGIAPGALVTIYAAGLAPGLKGAVVANTLGIGALPTKLNDVEVSFGGIAAPILSVANIDGKESISVQVPWELPASSQTTLRVSVSGGSTTLNNVAVQSLSPGIFESTDAQGRRSAIVLRPDGSFVSPENPARRNERLKIFATGLGQLTPNTGTNRVGVANQNLIAPLIVGVNNEGLEATVTTTLSTSMVGVYEISFQLNSTTATGQRNLSIGVDGPNGRVFSNTSNIASIQ